MDCRDITVSEDYADFIIEFNTTAEEFIENYKDFCPSPIGTGYGTIFKQIDTNIPFINTENAYEEIPKLYGLMDIVAVDDTGALKLQNFPGLELKGSGIIIGIIGDGIDSYHEAFRYSNGDTRILSVWDQTNQTLEPPSSRMYGSNITRDIINEELKTQDSDILRQLSLGSSHGTFVAGIAAGTNNTQKGFASPAPLADIVVVKLKPAKNYLRQYYKINANADAYQENDIMNAVAYMRDVAIQYERPVIICIPLGTSSGAHSGVSVIGDLLNNTASRTGIGICIANGNEGNSRHHYSGKINSSMTYDDVQIRVAENIIGFNLELWGQSPDIFTVEITSPTGEVIKRSSPREYGEKEYTFLFEKTKVYINYEIVERRTGSELIQIRFDIPTAGIWTIRVYGDNIVNGEFNLWLPISEFVGADTYFIKPDPFITLTPPSDTFTPISVGAYSNETNGIFLESGRGYPIDMTIKPEFAAPGVNVFGPGLNNSYVSRSGTSVAAGLTAGVMAQYMEWGIVRGNRINMNTTEIKNYLIRGAKRNVNLTYPNREWGYGILDAYNSIDVLRG